MQIKIPNIQIIEVDGYLNQETEYPHKADLIIKLRLTSQEASTIHQYINEFEEMRGPGILRSLKPFTLILSDEEFAE